MKRILDKLSNNTAVQVLLNEQGKGEFTFNLDRNDIEIKAIAMLYEKQVPLIGFKGNKIDNYEEILFAGEEDYDTFEDDDAEYEYEEISNFLTYFGSSPIFVWRSKCVCAK